MSIDTVVKTEAAVRKITRAEAQRRAEQIFGPQAFARKSTKTTPGNRYQIGIRSRVGARTVEVIGAGRDWKEATLRAVEEFERRGLA